MEKILALKNFLLPVAIVEKFRFVLNNELIHIDTANFAQEAFLFRKNTKL